MGLALQGSNNDRYISMGLVTMNGTKHTITTEEYNRLMELSLDDMFVFDGKSIKASTIAETLPLEEFYTQFPEQRPSPVYANNSSWLEVDMLDNKSSKTPENALPEMIKGLEKYCKENPNAKKAKVELHNLKQRLLKGIMK